MKSKTDGSGKNFLMKMLEKLTDQRYTRVSSCKPEDVCHGTTLFVPVRFIIVFAIVLSCAVDYITRVNINVSIVAMTKPHPQAHISGNTCPYEEEKLDIHFGNSSVSIASYHDHTHNIVNPNLTYEWSPRTQGVILGSFWYSYMCMQVPSARMAEERGGKVIVAISLVGSAVINLITPLITDSLAALITSRLVLGVLQGGIFPSCYAMLYKWMPQKERSLAFAFMDVGGTIGSIVASSLSGYLSEHGFAGGWPSSFYVSGIISLFTFVLWWLLTYSVPEEHPFISEEELAHIVATRGTGKNENQKNCPKPRPPWKAILSSPAVLAVIVSKFSLGWIFFTILSKLPAYLNDVLHVSPTENGLMNASLYTATIISLLTAGLVSERIIQTGLLTRTRCRKIFASIASMGALTCLALVPSAGCSKGLVISLFILANFCMGCGSGGDGPVPSELTTNFPATIFSIANMVSCSSGFVAPYVIGVILESDAGDLHFLWSIVFYLASSIAFCGILVFITFGEASIQSWDETKSFEMNILPELDDSDVELFNSSNRRRSVSE